MNQSQKYALHLDLLRRKNKFTVEQFCSAIVDPRTFRRYKTGEKNLSYAKISAFCERLRISTSDFYFSAKADDKIERKRINDIYHLLVKKDYDSFNKIVATTDKDHIFDIQNRRFFDLCVTIASLDTKTKSTETILASLYEIANYPACIDFTAFDFVSISAIIRIAEIEIKDNKEDAMNLLINILTDNDMIYTSSENIMILPTIYADVCILLLRLKRFKAANYIAENGIHYLLRIRSNNGLSHLYYTKAYANLMLDNVDEAELNAVRCLLTATSKQSNYEIELFYRVLKKDFKTDPYQFIEKHLKTLLTKENPQ